MSINSTLQTLLPGDTQGPGSSTGLIAGLAIFFLLVITVTGAILYKYHSRFRDMLQSGRGGGGEGGRGSQKRKDYPETAKDDHQHYTSLIRGQETAAVHSPIYENVSSHKSGHSRKQGGNHGSSPGEPEEDVYLQCDSADNAIYHNDPDCRLVITSQQEEEDVYIMPDS